MGPGLIAFDRTPWGELDGEAAGQGQDRAFRRRVGVLWHGAAENRDERGDVDDGA